jgi:acyl-[acyl-carrier-protein]-phospholipid O-acyltransferase / long-chain-fatty-acid--[acyl-carrier-protein] ligase
VVDRYSRFAKIAGEMISLAAVEEKLREILAEPELDLVTVNLPDEKKGERIVALIATERDVQNVRQELIAGGMQPLMAPAEIYLVKEVPKLGSGKTDFHAARRVAMEFSCPDATVSA